MRRGLLRAGAGERAHLELVVALLARRVRLSSVPTIPQKKPIGIDTRPGLRSGNQAKSADGNSDVAVPEPTGEKITSTTAATRPP